MARWSDMQPASQKFMEKYSFPELPAPPLVRLEKSLPECKALLVTTAGLHMKGDPPFNTMFLMSDCSYRILPVEARWEDIDVSHHSKEFDRSGIKEDLNVVYPVDRFQEFVEEGVLRALAQHHYSFMGSVPRIEKLVDKYAPEVAKRAGQEGVDIAFLTPV